MGAVHAHLQLSQLEVPGVEQAKSVYRDRDLNQGPQDWQTSALTTALQCSVQEHA